MCCRCSSPGNERPEVLQVKVLTNQTARRPRGGLCSVCRSPGALPRDPAPSAGGFRRIRVIVLHSPRTPCARAEETSLSSPKPPPSSAPRTGQREAFAMPPSGHPQGASRRGGLTRGRTFGEKYSICEYFYEYFLPVELTSGTKVTRHLQKAAWFESRNDTSSGARAL